LNTTATKSFTGWSPATFAAEDLFEQHSKAKASIAATSNVAEDLCYIANPKPHIATSNAAEDLC
jgi:hypothetical protein